MIPYPYYNYNSGNPYHNTTLQWLFYNNQKRRKEIENNKNWVKQMFQANKPTLQYIKNYINSSATSYWPAFNACPNPKPNRTYRNIGTYDIYSNNSELKVPELSYNNSMPAIEGGCNEVYKMMKELNEENNWNLKIHNKCDSKSNLSEQRYVTVTL